MRAATDRYELASDNTTAICPEAWAELESANHDEAASYGDDQWTQRLCNLVREIFETDCDVYLVFNFLGRRQIASDGRRERQTRSRTDRRCNRAATRIAFPKAARDQRYTIDGVGHGL